MTVHVLGAGAAGSALALALHRLGWPLGVIARRTEADARARCEALGGGTPAAVDGFAEALRAHAEAPGPHPPLLLITVPDRLLAPTAAALAGDLAGSGAGPAAGPAAGIPALTGEPVALHLSGSEEVEALAPLRAVGLAVGGLHPLKSFVDLETGARLEGVVCALEGDEAARALARRLAEALGARPFELAPGTRAAWHAGAAHACNHLVALVDQALDLLEAAGLPRDDGRAALLPLVEGTVENLKRHPPGQALTGPVARGDAPVVARHLDALATPAAGGPDGGLATTYRALALRAVELAQGAGRLDGPQADELRRVLTGDVP